DLREIANLQQQLVGAQQTMEREYARLRHLETRYRLLFQISTEPVLIAETSSDRISEVNPAAAELFGETTDRLVGRNLASVFSTEAWPQMRSMLDEVKVTGASRDVQVGLPFSETTVRASASLFRRESSSFYLVRLNAAGAGGESLAGEDSRLLEVLRGLPDAFVLIDSERRVIAVNGSFLDLAQLATEQQARRASLEDWLGRPGVDLNILMANLREHGSVRNFATVLRGQFGSVEEVEVSGVAATTGTEPCYGFMIRPVISRFDLETPLGGELPSSVQQLTGMVGRVPLKEIIRRTTDVIESLCIEAALEVSGDNRASAAQMLGLSRQSLYAKLRRHGIGDLDGGSSDS
ncbi:MAG: transcriptional regulator PpsR, partial [Myxococcota bacterium]